MIKNSIRCSRGEELSDEEAIVRIFARLSAYIRDISLARLVDI